MKYFQLKQVGFFSKELQIFLILFLFIIIVIYRYKKRGRLTWEEDQYSVHFAHMFTPVYEEIIFRGLIFQGLLMIYQFLPALMISSSIFGIWHLKNIFIFNKKKVLFQILYAGLIFSPIVSYVMYISQTIWLGVIIHYINNLWSQMQWNLYKKIGLAKISEKFSKLI